MPGTAIPTPLRRAVAKEAVRFLALLAGDDDEASTPRQLALWADHEWPAAEVQARVMVADRFVGMLRAVQRAIRSGEIPKEWDRSDRMQQLVTTGLEQYDPRIAFQAALRTAYSAGRYERATSDDALEDEPYFLYRTMRDERVRSSHQALNGVLLPKRHEFWATHMTPNGWRCRCKVVSIDDEGAARLEKAGVPLQREAPEEATVEYRDKVTGEVKRLPASIEPGWDFNPGTDDGRKRMEAMLKRRMQMLGDPALI